VGLKGCLHLSRGDPARGGYLIHELKLFFLLLTLGKVCVYFVPYYCPGFT